MPSFKSKTVRQPDGTVVVKTVTTFSPEEAANVERITDDPNVKFATLRSKDYNEYFAYLRLLFFWGDIWNHRHAFDKDITRGMRRREILEEKAKNRKRRKRK